MSNIKNGELDYRMFNPLAARERKKDDTMIVLEDSGFDCIKEEEDKLLALEDNKE